MLGQRLHRIRSGRLRPSGHDRRPCRQRDEGDFVQQHADRARPRQRLNRKADAPQRIKVEQQQNDRQRHAPSLGQQRCQQQQQRRDIPAPTARAAGGITHVTDHARQQKEDRQYVAPLRRPSHGLDPQRVHGKEQRSHRGHRQRSRRWASGNPPCQAQEPRRQQIEEHGVQRVQHKIRQVVTKGVIYAPNLVIDPVADPREGVIVPHKVGVKSPL